MVAWHKTTVQSRSCPTESFKYMTDILRFHLPKPKNWQDFEELARDLFDAEWKTDDTELHGRPGQSQHGVDVYGTDRQFNKLVGVQCKLKNGNQDKALKENEIREEVEKAKNFTPPLDRFILATTGLRDANNQKVAREINDQHKKSGLFEFSVMGWCDIERLLSRHPEVVKRHMPRVPLIANRINMSTFNQPIEDHDNRIIRKIESLPPRDSLTSIITKSTNSQPDDILGQRITDVTDLLIDTPPQNVISRLKKLLKNNGQRASPRNRFRINANLGTAYFAMGDKETTIKYFREAYREYPDNAEGLSILAAAESIAENSKEAICHAKRAMQMLEPQQRAVAVFLANTPISTPWNELQQQIPEQFRYIPENLLLFAQHAQNNGQIEDCRRLIKDAVRRDPENWRIHSHAGSLLFEEMEDQEIRSFCLLKKHDIAIVEEAREHFLKAWQILKVKDTGWISAGEIPVTNAILISLLLRDKEQADILLKESFQQFGETQHWLRFQAVQQMNKGLFAEMITTIHKIPAEDRDSNDDLTLVQAMIHGGDPEEALIRATELYSTTENKNLQIIYAGCRISAAVRISSKIFFSITPEILSIHQNDTLVLAEYVSNYPSDNIDQKIIDRLIAATKMEKDSFSLNRAAYALDKAGRYSAAANIFNKICNPDMDTPQLMMALRTLIESDRNKEAKVLYGKVDTTIKNSADMRRTGVSIFYNEGNLNAARDELAHIFGTDDEALEDRMIWIEICERIPDITSVLEYLNEVQVDIDGDPLIRMQLALKINHISGNYKKALEIGYRALQDGYDNPHVHMGYIFGLISLGNTKGNFKLETDVVAKDTAVVVVPNHGKPFTRVIVTSPASRVGNNEIPIDESLAQRLLGKTIGESIEMDSIVGKIIGTIEKIESKYLYACNLAMKESEQLFPENEVFRVLHLDEIFFNVEQIFQR